jgi:hypothetical protein
MLFFGYVLLIMFSTTQGDYVGHVAFAISIAEAGILDFPHILYHVLVIALVKLLPFLNYVNSGLLVCLAFSVATTVLLYRMIRPVLSGSGWRPSLLAGLFTTGLMILTNISLFDFQRQNFYAGSIPVNVYHNPTILVLRPLALLTFIFALSVLQNHIHFNLHSVSLCILIIMLCMLAKPNFLLCLLPALLLISLYRWFRHESVPWCMFMIGIIVPISILLTLQYLATFASGSDSRIIIAPFLWVEDTSFNLIPKLILSILFPLCILAFYWKTATTNLALAVSWLSFGFGAAQLYLLAETGERMTHGNFQWSAQITLFVLFVFSLVFWVQQDRRKWQWWVCAATFGLHVLSGVVFLTGDLTPY